MYYPLVTDNRAAYLPHPKCVVSCILIFSFIAKRAYLHTLAFPPPILVSSDGQAVSIRPYDGPDAQAIIQNVNSRGQLNPGVLRSHNVRSASISVLPNTRSISGVGNANYRSPYGNGSNQHITLPELPNGRDREPSPTLPSLPSQPTLNSLISSSLGETVTGPNIRSDSHAILTTSL